MKLINILNEIKVVGGVKRPYKMSPSPSLLKPPTSGETMASWLKRNKVEYSWDKYKLIQYRVNCSVNIRLSIEKDRELFSKLTKNDINNPEKYDKFIIKPIVGEWQSYFDGILGERKVKVWMDNREQVRIILPNSPSPDDFKMLP